MSDKFFVDTNILVYAEDTSSGVKRERAKELVEHLWRTGSGVISTQVVQELCISLQRKVARRPDSNAIRDLVADYLRWQVVVNTGQSVLDALEIQDRFGISFWDAMIVQAAESGGAEVIYSEDLSDGQTYGFVRVVNPLAAVR